jgi:hypothetical protein
LAGRLRFGRLVARAGDKIGAMNRLVVLAGDVAA